MAVILVAGLAGLPAEGFCDIDGARWTQPATGYVTDSWLAFVREHQHTDTKETG